MSIDAKTFLADVRPALEAGDAQALAQVVAQRWSAGVMCRMLQDDNLDARRASAISLGLVGDRDVVPCLARALKDADRQVSQMAEHGLWSIWFRSGSRTSRCYFREGLALLEEESFFEAADRFKLAGQIDSTFSEAFHQCAIAQQMLGESDTALRYFKRAVEEEPHHFAAYAGMGSCLTELGDLKTALRAFRKALSINPRMPSAANAIDKLQTTVCDTNDWSGIYTAQVG